MIKKIFLSTKNYIEEFSFLVFFLLLISYFNFFIYLFNYNKLFIFLDQKSFTFSSLFRYSIFSLSFITIVFIFIFLVDFLIFTIFRKSNKKIIIFITSLLEIFFNLYIYADLLTYKLLGVHLHNDIVIGALNKKDLSNDLGVDGKNFINLFIYPILFFILTLIILFLLIKLKKRLDLMNFFKKVSSFLFILMIVSVLISMYPSLKLSKERNLIPFWSYIDKTSSDKTTENIDSIYGNGFNYDKIKIKNKKNTIIIFTGDHGELFWEYGHFGHTRTSYKKESVEMPFVFYIPDLDKNMNIDISSHADIMTTLLSYITTITKNDIKKYFNGISLLDESSTKENYVLVSSFNFMGLKSKIALINKNGKLILESYTNKIKNRNLFKTNSFTDFNDKILSNKASIKSLLNDFKKFKDDYLKFIRLYKK